MSEEILPCNLAPLITSHAAEHAAQSGLNPGGYLVARDGGGNTFDESTLLVAIGEGKIVGENAVGRELAGAGRLCQERPKGLCCTDDEGRPFGAAL